MKLIIIIMSISIILGILIELILETKMKYLKVAYSNPSNRELKPFKPFRPCLCSFIPLYNIFLLVAIICLYIHYEIQNKK